MHKYHTHLALPLGILGLLCPQISLAQRLEPSAFLRDAAALDFLTVAGFLLLSLVLTRAWVMVMNINLERGEDGKEFHLPHAVQVVVATVLCTLFLSFFAFKTLGGVAPFNGPHALRRLIIFFVCAGIFGIGAQIRWKKARGYFFAFIVATLISFILFGFKEMVFGYGTDNNPFLMSLVIVSIILAWRFLFGPWKPHVKTMVLATFIAWAAVHMLAQQTPTERLAHVLTAIIAFIPAVIWCLLFLDFHLQRLSHVFLMFFSGMIATAPVLFYDRLVRQGVEMHFFLFRVVPENFNSVSTAFVSSNISGFSGVRSTLLATLISFLIVGLIEEVSKFWTLKKSGMQFFTSIDDVMQLSIIVGIGFAFAENVLNPGYFLNFVKSYLIHVETPQWSAFLGSMMGRSILTTMVHILASGVLGYFFGLALFARSYMDDGGSARIASFFHTIFRIPKKRVFRIQMMSIGFFIAIGLHGLFNFLVTLQDILPGHPRTLGELFNRQETFLDHISLLLIPSLFYVVGGFWLLSTLFLQKVNQKERGRLVVKDTFVRG